MKTRLLVALVSSIALAAAIAVHVHAQSQPTYDITTLAGKVASLNGTAGLQIRFSSFIEAEAGLEAPAPNPGAPITPTFVLSSPLDETTVAPAVTANQDTGGAPQNETAIAVDPNNADRLVAGANDYVTGTWGCTINGVPCSASGDGYSGTFYSNDGGTSWCCSSTDPAHLGTLIPGVTKLTGGQYDAAGDPSVAFDSRGHVFYSGLGFNRTSAPNTVAVNKGTFDGVGHLTWGPPTFINPTTSPAILNDKSWIAADSNPSSPFRDRVYVTWTRFIFNPRNGRYVQSPIAFVFSSDGGATFSDPVLICGNVLYGQGSRPVVGPDGTVYVFWNGSTRLATLNSTYMVKSTDGGLNWSKPVAVAPVVNVAPILDTAFRVDSYPAAAVAPDGTLYAAWTTEVLNTATTYGASPVCAYFISGLASVYANCHSQTAYSSSTDGGLTWSTPQPIFAALDAANRTPDGYPVTQPDGSTLDAPAAHRVDTQWPAIAVTPTGRVYMSAYAATLVSPWQTCAKTGAGGSLNCAVLGSYVHNARLEYYVTRPGTGTVEALTGHPINSRYQFSGTFLGDYTALTAGPDERFHAFWTDTNNAQTVTWWFGAEFTGLMTNQQDVVTRAGIF
jgi:hypothetical protein